MKAASNMVAPTTTTKAAGSWVTSERMNACGIGTETAPQHLESLSLRGSQGSVHYSGLSPCSAASIAVLSAAAALRTPSIHNMRSATNTSAIQGLSAIHAGLDSAEFSRDQRSPRGQADALGNRRPKPKVSTVYGLAKAHDPSYPYSWTAQATVSNC